MSEFSDTLPALSNTAYFMRPGEAWGAWRRAVPRDMLLSRLHWKDFAESRKRLPSGLALEEGLDLMKEMHQSREPYGDIAAVLARMRYTWRAPVRKNRLSNWIKSGANCEYKDVYSSGGYVFSTSGYRLTAAPSEVAEGVGVTTEKEWPMVEKAVALMQESPEEVAAALVDVQVHPIRGYLQYPLPFFDLSASLGDGSFLSLSSYEVFARHPLADQARVLWYAEKHRFRCVYPDGCVAVVRAVKPQGTVL